jgi:hypothetical protein
VRRQVRSVLPPGLLTAAERLLVLEIADFVGDKSREGWPGVEALAEATDLSLTSIPPMLARIAEKWIELRVQVGTDTKGRPVYGRKGHRTIFRFPSTFADEQTSTFDDEQTSDPQGLLKPAVPTDGEQTLRAERFAPQQAKVCSSSTPSPQEPSKNFPQSLSQATSPTDMLATLGVEERERDRLIQKIEEQNNVQGVGWWINARKNGTLADCLQRARADPPDTHAMTWDEVRRNGGKTTPPGSRSVAHNGFKPYRNPENPETAYAGYTHRRPSTAEPAAQPTEGTAPCPPPTRSPT